MNIEPLSQTDLSDVEPMGFDEATPLWFYILKEAELMAEGRMLGPVGGRIVAEVFIGLLQGDRVGPTSSRPRPGRLLWAGTKEVSRPAGKEKR